MQMVHADRSVHNDCIRLEHSEQWAKRHGLFLSQTELQADAFVSDAGLTNAQADEVENSLMAIPSVHMAAHCVVDGEDASTDIMETDIVTCAVRVVLTRHSHLAAG